MSTHQSLRQWSCHFFCPRRVVQPLLMMGFEWLDTFFIEGSWASKKGNYREHIDAMENAILYSDYFRKRLFLFDQKISIRKTRRMIPNDAIRELEDQIRLRKCQALARHALDSNSRPSSWTMVFRAGCGRERRRVRSLSCNLPTIYRTLKNMRRTMNIRQFRLINHRLFPKFKKRMNWDMCDHYETCATTMQIMHGRSGFARDLS